VSPRELTDAEWSGSSWYGYADATPLPAETQLVGVRLGDRSARPWSLTCYAATAGGGQTLPTTPVGVVTPDAGGAVVAVAPTMPNLGAVLRLNIGAELVTMDYPTLGAVYQLSPCSQVSVSVYSTWTGSAAPDPIPRYACRIHESPGYGDSWVHKPRYTLPLHLTPGTTENALIPGRAVAVTVLPGDILGDSDSVIRLRYYDATGLTLYWTQYVEPYYQNTSGGLKGPQIQQVYGPTAIPPLARLVVVDLPQGAEELTTQVIWHLSL